jgi:hypothetical protein
MWIALVRLLKPLEFYKEIGTVSTEYKKMYLLMEKQHNGQDGAGFASSNLMLSQEKDILAERSNHAQQDVLLKTTE